MSVGGDIYVLCSVESFVGGRDGEINIFFGIFVDLVDNFFGGGVDDIEFFFVDVFDLFVVNVVRVREVSVWFLGSF